MCGLFCDLRAYFFSLTDAFRFVAPGLPCVRPGLPIFGCKAFVSIFRGRANTDSAAWLPYLHKARTKQDLGGPLIFPYAYIAIAGLAVLQTAPSFAAFLLFSWGPISRS